MKYRCMQERLIANSFLDKGSGCWIWLGKKVKDGYGRINIREAGLVRALPAHRASWMAFKGPIPRGFDIDHLCKRRDCIAPDHLRPLPYKEHRLSTIFSKKRQPREEKAL